MKYVKNIFIILFILAIFLLLKSPAKTQQTEYLMDTVITITAYDRGAKKAVNSAFAEIKRIDGLLSAYNPESEISKINEQASQGFVKTTQEVYGLLKKSTELSEKTDGAFDITLKPVSDLWQVGTECAQIPDDAKIKEALKLTGWQNLEFNDETLSVHFKIPGMAIDLGAIAKGYASDCAYQILKENGVKSALLDLGGNVAVIGKLPLSGFSVIKNGTTSRPFTIGIQNPDSPRGDVMEKIVANEDIFVITSGNYERFFKQDGKIYHHIIDPKTGYPSDSGIKSATVVTKSGTIGDALSTAAFVLGKDENEKISHLCDEIIYIDDNLNIFR